MATPAAHYDLLPQQRHQPQPQHHQQLPRSQTKPRSFSVRSDKSHRSAVSKNETHEEKESNRLQSKADPTLAINEAEPSTVAMNAQSTHTPLRSLQHKDVWGNPITDPDKSNPTRNRWERPLDTIRGFEAAIDGGYSRKATIPRSETDSSGTWNQRGHSHPQTQPRFPQDSYYRPSSVRTDTHHGSATTRSSYMDSQHGHGRHGPRDRGPRIHAEPHYQVYGQEQNVYPLPHKDRSYETVASAAPSGHSDPAGYMTDPTSSDNSSVDRVSPVRRRKPTNDYAVGYNTGQAYHAPNSPAGRIPNHQDQILSPAHMEPRYYDADSGPQSLAERRQVSPPGPGAPEGRKSWFSRRFSRDA
ncbi:hypothetical protein L249_7299 [Ophiocordyceps polyrhachis-furcata BCC 54312]|uniref:Uncharacterized protein n=1 Tax=Ophiocordyceps polyrhachis-furcata BCC 54312 TaxID=1330021 RepID=A0A367LAP2_9HYPO|nr:hypothetical protein L249_7299 [Ophiocordyceps polyrhachis-furcata BCC 54312]